jgi:hypothetical protein
MKGFETRSEAVLDPPVRLMKGFETLGPSSRDPAICEALPRYEGV